MRTKLVVLLLMLSLAVVAAAPASSNTFTRAGTYRITIHNLTSGQPLSPPVAATHRFFGPAIFRVGHAARPGIELIAENGDNSMLAAFLDGMRRVHDVVALDAPIPPGQSASFEIDARHGDRLSLAAMLVCTNDGFTGVVRQRLTPGTHPLHAYDAGTEANAEAAEFLVPPCLGGQNLNDPIDTNEVVTAHPNIFGGVDLDPAVHGWTGPVAELEIEYLG